MLDPTKTYAVSINVLGIEIIALKRLALVSHALAEKIDGYSAKKEQEMLATTLDSLVRKIELRAATGAAS
jgi:hypothetical protein